MNLPLQRRGALGVPVWPTYISSPEGGQGQDQAGARKGRERAWDWARCCRRDRDSRKSSCHQTQTVDTHQVEAGPWQNIFRTLQPYLFDKPSPKMPKVNSNRSQTNQARSLIPEWLGWDSRGLRRRWRPPRLPAPSPSRYPRPTASWLPQVAKCCSA